MSGNVSTLRKVTLYRGVYPCGMYEVDNNNWGDVNKSVVDTLTKNNVVADGDLVILTKGMHQDNTGGGTNMMKILRVGDDDY